MMVVIHTDSRCAWTAPSMIGMPSRTGIWLVNVVSNLDGTLSLICTRRDDIWLINRQSTQFGVWNFHMGRMTLAHAQSNDHVSQFGH